MQPGLKYCILAQTAKKNISENGRYAAKRHFRVENARALARDISGTIGPIDLKISGMIQMPKTFKMTFFDF